MSIKNEQKKQSSMVFISQQKIQKSKKNGMLSHAALFKYLTADVGYFDFFLETAFGRGSSIKPFTRETVATSRTIVNGRPVVTAIA